VTMLSEPLDARIAVRSCWSFAVRTWLQAARRPHRRWPSRLHTRS